MRAASPARTARRSPRRPSRLVLFFKGNRLAVASIFVFLVIMAVAVLVPLFLPFDRVTRVNLREAFQPPSLEHLMGTDRLGRDVFHLTLWGSRVSLLVGLVGTFCAAAVGTVTGLYAGYKGGWWDRITVVVVDGMMGFPLLLLALTLVAMLGQSITNVIIAVGIAWVPRFVRLVRGLALSLRNNDYVESARATGASDTRIIFRHILINSYGPILVLVTLGVGVSMLVEAALSFLGVGTPPPTPAWGQMIAGGQGFLREAPWVSTFPGLALLVTVLALNILGDGLRDALDPRVGTLVRFHPDE